MDTVARVCSMEQCDYPRRAAGYCDMHYKRLKDGRDMNAPRRGGFKYLDSLGRQWTARSPNVNGYAKLYRKVDGKTVAAPEHRVFMEEYLGRELLPHENVHHINGIRNDNRLENLELWTINQPSGQRVSDLLEWAIDLITSHRPELLK